MPGACLKFVFFGMRGPIILEKRKQNGFALKKNEDKISVANLEVKVTYNQIMVMIYLVCKLIDTTLL